MASAVAGASTSLGLRDASRNDPVPHPCGSRRSCRPIVRLHAGGRMGRRRADLVRRRSAYSPLGHRGARNGRVVPCGPSLPCRRTHSRARSSREAARRAHRHAAHRACSGRGSDDALPLGWRRRGQSDGRLLHLAAVGRPKLRDGPRRLCGPMGSLLAGASVPVIKDPKWRDKALAIEYWLLTVLVAGSFVAGIVSAAKTLLE